MKIIKYVVLGLTFSVLMAISGVDATSYKEYTVLSLDVPGWNGVATVPEEEYTPGGIQYVKTESTIDKLTSKTRSASARVRAMSYPSGYTSWVGVPNGGNYKSLGKLDSNIYKLQIKENTWSSLGFYWIGKWKIPN